MQTKFFTNSIEKFGSLGIAVVGCIRANHEIHPHIFLITTENPQELEIFWFLCSYILKQNPV
jgi:hypothetical protein